MYVLEIQTNCSLLDLSRDPASYMKPKNTVTDSQQQCWPWNWTRKQEWNRKDDFPCFPSYISHPSWSLQHQWGSWWGTLFTELVNFFSEPFEQYRSLVWDHYRIIKIIIIDKDRYRDYSNSYSWKDDYYIRHIIIIIDHF